jgi:methylenetetrahydrofolate reductase (NADPH)
VRPVGRLRRTLQVSPIAVAPDWRQPLLTSVSRPRYEILPLNGIVEGIPAHVPADVKLTVTASPKPGLDATLAVTEELRRHGIPSCRTSRRG